MWQELITVVDNLRRAYQSLASLEKKKHQALVTVDLPTVESLTREEEFIINQVAKLEAKRRGLVLGISAKHYGENYDLTMAEVIDLASSVALRDKLNRLHTDLTAWVNETQAQNEINSILLHGALNAVNASLSRIGGLKTEPVYGSGGQDIVTRKSKINFDA